MGSQSCIPPDVDGPLSATPVAVHYHRGTMDAAGPGTVSGEGGNGRGMNERAPSGSNLVDDKTRL